MFLTGKCINIKGAKRYAFEKGASAFLSMKKGLQLRLLLQPLIYRRIPQAGKGITVFLALPLFASVDQCEQFFFGMNA